MNTVDRVFDSRAMPLLEPSTAPIAFSLWDWLAARIAAKPADPRRESASAPVEPAHAEHATPHTPR